MTASGPAPAGPVSGTAAAMRRFAAATWDNVREYWGFGDATCLWPRWIVLRAIGILYATGGP